MASTALKKVKPNVQPHEVTNSGPPLQGQHKEVKFLSEKLAEVSSQLKKSESRLAELKERELNLEEKEQEVNKRLLDLAELKQKQENEHKRAMAELIEAGKEAEEEYRRKLDENEDMRARQEEEYQNRILNFDNEMKERVNELKKYIDIEFKEREEAIAGREAQALIRESVVAEKEKFWASMYDAVVKLTRVVSASK
ncbi:MAG: hypothetical protein ACYC0Q_14675 [Eubacteriales bacterium]